MIPSSDYYRMSTDKQETSIPQQMAAVAALAEREGLKIIATYKDEGISGGGNDRAELQRLIAEVKKNRIEAVVCYALDRLSRSDALDAMGEVFYPLKKAGVRWIITTKEKIDLKNVVGQTMLGLEQNFSCHQEKISIADRTSRGRYDLWREGYWISNKPPYGYRIVERRDSKLRGPGRGAGRLSIYEPEAAEVRRCFDLYEQLRSSRLVALAMGQSTDWVAEKLDRAVYCGRLSEPRKRRGKHYRFSLGNREHCAPGTEGNEYRPKSTDEWVEGIFPQIITTDQFDRVQRLLKGGQLRKAGAELRRKRRDHLFSQMLWCGDCKKMMYAKCSKQTLYVCGGHLRGDGCTEPRTIGEEGLKEAIIKQIREDFEKVGGVETLRRTLMSEVEGALAVRDTQSKASKTLLERLEQEIALARKGLLRLATASEDIYREAVKDVERMMSERDEVARNITKESKEAEFRILWT
jgi:site-specific DNA recombinase